MRDWAFWEWIAYGTLALSAFCLAFDSALKHAPNMRARMPRLLGDPIWPFLPLILLILSTAIFLARELGVVGGQRNVTHQEQAAQPKPTSKATERIFVGATITPRFLTSQFEKFTGVQVPLFVEPYIGKWMRLSGKVNNINKGREIMGLSFQDESHALMFFEKSWLERLRVLRQGDQITVVGMITDIDQGTVILEHCEVVENAK